MYFSTSGHTTITQEQHGSLSLSLCTPCRPFAMLSLLPYRPAARKSFWPSCSDNAGLNPVRWPVCVEVTTRLRLLQVRSAPLLHLPPSRCARTNNTRAVRRRVALCAGARQDAVAVPTGGQERMHAHAYTHTHRNRLPRPAATLSCLGHPYHHHTHTNVQTRLAICPSGSAFITLNERRPARPVLIWHLF